MYESRGGNAPAARMISVPEFSCPALVHTLVTYPGYVACSSVFRPKGLRQIKMVSIAIFAFNWHEDFLVTDL